LRDLIIEGKLPPGTKVPERELCERYGVSRTPMREALKVLAVDGLVWLEPNRGAWVSKITIDDLEEVFPVMGALEALSGELACERITDKQIASIRDTHNDMVKYYEARDLTQYFRANQAIHEAILDAAGNTELTAMYRSLSARIRRARYIANMTEERWKKAVEEHEQILAALEKRQGHELGQILRLHLASKFETVRQWLSDNEA
ncbi:MAG: GntR family transcriptional regulator, partial [Pseudomonadota bacterium]